MINLKHLVENKKYYIDAFEAKGNSLSKEVDKVISLYKTYLKEISKEQDIRNKLNIISNEIKLSKSSDLKTKASKLSSEAKDIKKKISDLNQEINNIASYFPNPAGPNAPKGKTEKDNKVIKTFFDDKKIDSSKNPHWDIIDQKKLVLLKEASNLSGTRHVVYYDKAALLIKALETFLIDNNVKFGYKLIEAPVIVNEQALFNTTQLPKFKNDLFKLDNGQYLIPTSEVTLTNLFADKIYTKEELPIKYTTSSLCFRKEAGAAGKDTRGIIRMHQFRKVEIVKLGLPENEKKDFDEMVKCSTDILNKLKIPYRLVELCTGDLSFASRKTIDIEVWMPGINNYREISSISSVGDFQARRMKSRIKLNDGKKEFLYTYNGSSLAIDRLFAAIISNFINDKNEIIIPKPLHKYLSFTKI